MWRADYQDDVMPRVSDATTFMVKLSEMSFLWSDMG